MLRVTVHVPQANAFAITDGLYATAYLPQKPEQTFSGKIARILGRAAELRTHARHRGRRRQPDRRAASRRLRQRDLRRAAPAPQRRAAGRGPDLQQERHAGRGSSSDDEVHLQTISIYRDFGKTVELRDGLNGGEQIVSNPPVDVTEHMKVKVKEKPPEEQGEEIATQPWRAAAWRRSTASASTRAGSASQPHMKRAAPPMNV